jgi:hypothetical protein
MGQDPLARYEQYRVKTVPPPDPNAGQRDPLSALSKATGISAAPEDPQYRYPADTPKGPGRFLSEAYKNSQLNVSAVKDTLTEFLRNPVLTPVNIVNSTLDDMRSQARKALDHIQTNRPLDAANDVILAFPLLGPMVRRGMEQMEKGDTAGGLGAITGAVSQLAAPEVIARAAPAIASARVKIPALLPNRNPKMAAAVTTGIEAGIPVDLATASGIPAVRAVQQANDFTPPGALAEYFAKPKRDAALTKRATELGDAVYPAFYSAEDLGQSVRTTTQKAIDTLTQTADEQYGIFRGLAGQEPVDIASAQARLMPMYKQMVRESELVNPVGAKATNLIALDRFMQFDAATANLADVDRALGDLKALARKSGGGAINVQVEALEKQVQAAARRAGQPAVDALTAGRDAIKARVPLREALDEFTGTGTYFEPAKAYGKLVRPSDTSINFLRAIQKVDPDLPLQTGRAWLETHLAPVTEKGGFENVDKLVAEWNKLGPSSKPLLFGGTNNVTALDQLMRLAQELNKVHNRSGSTTMGVAVGSLAGLMAFPAEAIMGLLGAGSISAITRSPAAVKLLTQGMTKMLGPGRSSAPAVAKAAQAAALANIMAARREAGIEEQ